MHPPYNWEDEREDDDMPRHYVKSAGLIYCVAVALIAGVDLLNRIGRDLLGMN